MSVPSFDILNVECEETRLIEAYNAALRSYTDEGDETRRDADDTTFEVIKMDTQGSELDIMKGGKNLCKRASIIKLEVSLVELNEGAPVYDEVVGLMEDFGFEERMSIGEHYEGDEIIQKDLVFLNKDRLE